MAGAIAVLGVFVPLVCSLKTCFARVFRAMPMLIASRVLFLATVAVKGAARQPTVPSSRSPRALTRLATWRRRAPSAYVFVRRRVTLRAVEAAWRQHVQEVEAQAAIWRRDGAFQAPYPQTRGFGQGMCRWASPCR
ncbi:unnamed protein product [Prorocentrum cordatum]|uniref:Secreted protein n=1 Tax=Prorocentrum cordatum TaxID=2364126 RepID=A0ABN9R388_9DINO|nr:unnamed protein product [Polarella glacialis]